MNKLSTKHETSTNILGILMMKCSRNLILWFRNWHWKTRRLSRMTAKIPAPIDAIGFEFHADCESLIEAHTHLFENNPDIFKFWLGSNLVIVLNDPEHLNFVLNHSMCLEKDSSLNIFKTIMGYGLITAPVHIWRKNRQLIHPVLNSEKIRYFVFIFCQRARHFVESLKKDVGNNNLDIHERIYALNMEILCETVMGISSEEHVSYACYKKLLDRGKSIAIKSFFDVLYQSDFPFGHSRFRKELYNVVQELRVFTDEFITVRRKLLEKRIEGTSIEKGKTENDHESILDMLLQFSHDECTQFSDQALRDEINTLTAAGSDSTSYALSFCFLTMGMHPDIQEKLYDEVMEVLGEDRDVTFEDLPHLEYMEMFIKETLRLFPPIPIIFRIPLIDIELDDCTFPTKSTLALNIFQTHRSSKYWKDPLKFDPDRFLPEEVEKRHPYSFLPFSGGPRSCIGFKFAIMTMKTILATVLRRFLVRTKYSSIEEVNVLMTNVLKPSEGFRVSIEMRPNNYQQPQMNSKK